MMIIINLFMYISMHHLFYDAAIYEGKNTTSEHIIHFIIDVIGLSNLFDVSEGNYYW